MAKFGIPYISVKNVMAPYSIHGVYFWCIDRYYVRIFIGKKEIISVEIRGILKRNPWFWTRYLLKE